MREGEGKKLACEREKGKNWRARGRREKPSAREGEGKKTSVREGEGKKLAREARERDGKGWSTAFLFPSSACHSGELNFYCKESNIYDTN